MSKSKLGPIPDDHFENEPGPQGEKVPGEWSPEQQKKFDEETARLKELVRKKQD